MRHLKAKNRDSNTRIILLERLTPLIEEIENWKVQRDVSNSIEGLGLLEPLAVLNIFEEEKENTLRIDKGCNRYRAAQELGYTHIDCNVYLYFNELFKASEIQRKRSKAWRK